MNTPTHHTPSRSFRSIAAVLSFALLSTQFSSAAPLHVTTQTPQDTPAAAPIPPQITAAHKVFIVNGGADNNFPIRGDQAYNQVYAALQAWGRFQLVSSPEQADLILNLRDVAPITDVGGGDRTAAYAITSPAFQVTLTDPKTNVPLWTITSPVYLTGKGQTRARWTSIAVTNLVSRMKVLVNESLSSAESADLTTYPKTHSGLAAGVIVVAVVGGGLGIGLLMKHEFDQSVKNQDAQLCAQNPFFCNMPTP